MKYTVMYGNVESTFGETMTLFPSDGKMGDGTSTLDFHKRHGEVVVEEFDTDSFWYDDEERERIKKLPEDIQTSIHQAMMRTYRDAWRAGQTSDQAHCPIHSLWIHGGEAAELRKGIQSIIEDAGADTWLQPAVKMMQKLLDTVNPRDSLAHLELYKFKLRERVRDYASQLFQDLRSSDEYAEAVENLIDWLERKDDEQ